MKKIISKVKEYLRDIKFIHSGYGNLVHTFKCFDCRQVSYHKQNCKNNKLHLYLGFILVKK
jgi:hypothetical protein